MDISIDQEKGFITNWQDYSVHDGYGLRVLIFLKGCPLRCKWCQNPENVNPFYEIEYYPMLCQDCGNCSKICPIEGAIVEDKSQRIDRDKCTRCMLCCDTCPSKALVQVGQWITIEQVMNRMIRYQPFFKGSDPGGVTISGGEPTFQPGFTLRLLKSCREIGISTAIETCGFVSYEIFRDIAQDCDLILYDIKHMDDERHKRGVGQSNKLILENLSKLCGESDVECVVRIPLVPGFNDDEKNIEETAKFVLSLKRPLRIDLLPFNELASSKYTALGLAYEYADARRQSDEKISRLKEVIQSKGLEVSSEGLW